MGTMGDYLVVALGLGLAISAVLALPAIARQYRTFGRLSAGRSLMLFLFTVYCSLVVAYTVLPPPDLNVAQYCSTHPNPRFNLLPFQMVADLQRETYAAPSYSAVVGGGVFRQVAANIVLFIPLGAFLRQLFSLSAVRVVLVGMGVSTFAQLTEFTGNWFLNDCSFRVGDVDDVMLNTFGTIIGLVFSPALRIVPGLRSNGRESSFPRPVTRGRRLLQMGSDLFILTLSGFAVSVVWRLSAAAAGIFVADSTARRIDAAVLLLVGFLLSVAVPLWTRGATLGERIVRIVAVRADGTPAPGSRLLVKSGAGLGLYAFLTAWETLSSSRNSLLQGWSFLFVLVSLLAVLRNPRGLAGWASGLHLRDERDPQGTDTPELTKKKPESDQGEEKPRPLPSGTST